MLAARVALVTFALCACAWFAVAVRAAHDQQQVAKLLASAHRLTTAQAGAALGKLDHAAVLNPDRALDLLRAEVLQRTGRPDRALAVLRRLVAAEPANIFAWELFYFAAHGRPDLAALALARVRALAPPVPAAP